MNEIRSRLMSRGNLIEFFGLQKSHNNKKKNMVGGLFKTATFDGMDQNNEDEDDKILNSMKNQDPFQIDVEYSTFNAAIKDNNINSQENRIRLLFETIRDNGKADVNVGLGNKDSINLGVIEDYALGFRQHNVKLFMFGQAHKSLGAFETKIEENNKGGDKKGKKRV